MIRFARNIFFEDVWLKLFSLGLAVLTWLTVWFAIQKEISPASALSRAKEVTFLNLPVSFLSTGADVRSFKVDPKEVQVTVQGDARILNSLKSKDIRVMVDLTNIEPLGNVRKRVEVSTPPGITHIRAVPEEVLVIFPARF